MPAQRSDVERLLERVLGFRREEGDHHKFRLEIGGRLIARTKTSHSHASISDDLLSQMARQMHITPAVLKALLAGKKNREDYLEALREQGLLPPR